jgi:hypothetical protein
MTAQPVAQLQQLLAAGQGIQSGGRTSRKQRREQRGPVRSGQKGRPGSGSLHHSEPRPVRVQPEDAENAEIAGVQNFMNETAIQRFVRGTGERLGPDPAGGHLRVARQRNRGEPSHVRVA